MGKRSEQLYAEARALLPGGVNSPVRAFGAVGGTPVFLESGSGARVRDADGIEYIDWLGSWGPLIAGHAHPRIVAALRDQAGRGTSFGAPCELETQLARRVCDRIPSCEKVRFVSSGTEATMSAIRLARAATGRAGVLKVEGCYHGHVDSLLVEAGSGVLTLSIPGTPGVPPALAALTRTVPFNDLGALEAMLVARGAELSCLILEPVAGNMGVVPPAPGYLQGVRELTRTHGVLLIFDEVMTGFRVDRGGVQTLVGITPDLSCFGKVIGGGLPVGAYGGRADLMDRIAPAGPVYQAGTLSGNPLAMRAGIEMLDLLSEPGTYEGLERVSARLAQGLEAAARERGVPATVNRVGSMLTAFFSGRPVTDYTSAKRSDTKRYARFFHAMLRRGVYLAPSQFEAAFVSTAHGDAEVDATLRAAREALGEIAAEGNAMVRLLYHGHSCFEIESGPHRILIDPFLEGNPLADVKARDFSKLDAILISHGHGDHVGDTVAIAKRTGAIVVSNYEIVNWLAAKGCKGHPMSIGGGHAFPFGHVKLTIAHHGSTGPEGEPLGSPAGFVITTSGKKLYHAGDTGLFLDMSLIAERSGPLDVALLPIGDNFTMGVDDAAKAAELVRAKMAIPMHYNTFDIIRADPQEFVDKVCAKGLAGVVVRPGAIFDVP